MSARPPLRAPAPRPVIGRAGRQPPHRRLTLVALAAAAFVAGGCGSPAPSLPPSTAGPIASPSATAAPSRPQGTAGPTPSPPATPAGSTGRGLLLLSTADGGRALSLLRPSADAVALPLPDPTTAAVAPLRDGTLVALLGDGRAFVAPGGPAGLLAGSGWRPLEIRWAGTLPGAATVFGATTAPDGTRLAAIARPPDAESPSALVVVDPARKRGVVRDLAADSLGAPPAWIDDARVALMQRGRDGRTFLAILAVATGEEVERIPLRALDVGTSGDGRTVVVLGDEGRLRVGVTDELLARRRVPDDGPATRPDDVVRGGVALDGAGRRLAAVVDDGVAGAGWIATFERAGGAWRATARIPAPAGSHGGTVAWLP